MRLLILGYYFKKNFGDDIFEHVFKGIFKNYDITIVNLDNIRDIYSQLATNEIKPFDNIIVGGGDLINDYYFNNESITEMKANFGITPIIFYGIGLSYPNLINLLDIGDYFFMRNKTDYTAVKARYTGYYSNYTPDLAYLLLNDSKLESYTNTSTKVENVAVCLPYTWFATDRDTTPFYLQILAL